MKKSLLSSLLMTLLCVTTAWAQFSPTDGARYALQETTTGLFLDIQTKGINEPNANGTTNNISLNVKPVIIFFEKGTNWKLKNINGEYVCTGSRNWNATVGTGNTQEFIIEGSSINELTIAKESGAYISMDNPVSGQPLYNNGKTGLKFKLIEYSNLPNQFTYTLKSETGTYMKYTTVSGSVVSYQAEPTFFYLKPSAGQFYIEDKNNADKFVGSTHSWNATTDFSMWTMLQHDEEGFAQIARAADNSKRLGSDQNTNAGTGIFTNVGDGCKKWLVEGSINYTTAGTLKSGKYHFTSDRLPYVGLCNRIRFTLTESAAYYKNGKKRMSFDSFELKNAKGNKVELTAINFEGNYNKSYASMLDGNNNTYCCGDWNATADGDDWFEITLDEDLGGAFSFSFVTENSTMNAKVFRIDFTYEKVEKEYTVNIIGAPYNAEVLYKGNRIENGTILTINEINADHFEGNDIEGYTWNVVIDEANKTVTITYTAIQAEENPKAVVDLVNRIGGEGTAEKFRFVLDPSMNSRKEVFVIGSENNKILIKGTTTSALTTGLGWYLQNIAKINIAWNSLNEKTVSGEAYADLGNLPLPAQETHVTDAKYRYYLNTCTFGYSMTSWTWKRWQQEIDWMALHGINMPLQLVGLEEVWRSFLTTKDAQGNSKYGYDETAAKAFVAGPAFIAWWAMNNLEGWGGTAAGTKSGGTWEGAGGVQDDAWYVRQKRLAKQITDRQRELGMQPVLPGWSGMVPTNFAKKSGYATRSNGGNWAGDFVRPLLLNVSNANYAEIAADYYACLKEVMGESQYYSMDPFHEGGGAGTMEDYEAMYAAMETAKPGSQWVIQQWQWSKTQKYSLTAVPAGRLIVLDLFSDGSPAFDGYNGYAPQEAVFCAIPNFGGRSGLMGRLNNLTDNYFKFKGKYSSIKGIGAAPEAIEQTPVTYDLLFQLPWMNGTKPDVAEWIKNYATARYGADNTVVQEAWELLRQGPLNYGADGIQGPVEDVWAARPNLNANKASSWGKTLNDAKGTYTKERQQMLINATYKLLSQKNALALNDIYESNYNYDIVEFGGAVMADYAYYLLLSIRDAKNAAGNGFNNDATYTARKNAFLALIGDVDTFKGTNLNFRLGKWTQEARDAAGEVDGATTATPDWYEYNNARTIVSTWSSPNTNLNDYSYRSWQGLMKDLYLPRWEYYFNNGCNGGEYGYFEWNWAHGMTHKVGNTGVSSTQLVKGEQGHTDSYTRAPEGNTVDEANKILAKYIIPVKMADGTYYYAYRHLANDLTGVINIPIKESFDLTEYFGDLDGATISGDFIESGATMSNATIKAGTADGIYTATITLKDATVLKFSVTINPFTLDPDKLYVIKSTANDEYCRGKYVYTLYEPTTRSRGNYTGTHDHNHLVFDDIADIPQFPQAVFQFENTNVLGKYKMKNLHTGLYVKSFSGTHMGTKVEAANVMIAPIADGQLTLKIGDNNPMHAQQDYGVIVQWQAEANNASTWTIDEVTEVSQVCHYVTISQAGYSTLFLNYPVAVPEGVTAYTANEIIDDKWLNMQEITNGIIPSNTAVVLRGKEGKYGFVLANEPRTIVEDIFTGTLYKQTIKKESGKYYVLANVDTTPDDGVDNKEVAFYNAVNNENENEFTNAANKAYLHIPEATKSLFYGFRFPDGETTGIYGIESEENKAEGIYDLQGRKLNEISQPGIYIINGKKEFVR